MLTYWREDERTQSITTEPVLQLKINKQAHEDEAGLNMLIINEINMALNLFQIYLSMLNTTQVCLQWINRRIRFPWLQFQCTNAITSPETIDSKLVQCLYYKMQSTLRSSTFSANTLILTNDFYCVHYGTTQIHVFYSSFSLILEVTMFSF